MDRRLQKFLMVAETRSFSEAAKRLHVSQPAITLALASLERAYDTKLYLRKRHTIELTPKGEIVAKYAKKIATEIDKLHAELDSQNSSRLYQLGIIDSLAYLLYSSSQNSDTLQDVEMMVDNSHRIISYVLSARLDAGIITGQPKALHKDIEVRKLHDETFVFVRAGSSTASATAEVNDWLAFNKDSTSFAHFAGLFRKLDLKVVPVSYSSSMELLKEMAIAGQGTALLPLHFVQDAIDQGRLQIVQTAPLSRPIWAIARVDAESARIDGIIARVDTLLR